LRKKKKDVGNFKKLKHQGRSWVLGWWFVLTRGGRREWGRLKQCGKGKKPPRGGLHGEKAREGSSLISASTIPSKRQMEEKRAA